MILEQKETKQILIYGGVPTTTKPISKKNRKLTKYRQLAFGMRERRQGCESEILPVVIGALGGGVKEKRTSRRDSSRNTKHDIDGR